MTARVEARSAASRQTFSQVIWPGWSTATKVNHFECTWMVKITLCLQNVDLSHRNELSFGVSDIDMADVSIAISGSSQLQLLLAQMSDTSD